MLWRLATHKVAANRGAAKILRRVIMKIYVGQLPHNVKENELKELFSEFGEITSVTLIMDHYSGRSKGFGFIDMPNNSEADKVIKTLNKSMFKGREIKVNQVQETRRNKRLKRRSRY
jgi:RNA recognition motif-containing protein